MKFFFTVWFTLFSFLSYSQTKDTLAYKPEHSPTKASIMSAILPGAGQVYNKKYWKVPIIYAVGGYLGYAVWYNNKEYHRFREDYKAATDNDPNTVDEFNGVVPAEQLQYVKDQYRRQRDLSFMALSVWYVLNIVDASVDANLYDFDVSDDLSLKLFNNGNIFTLRYKIK
jgi:hypothetical protein